MWLLKSINATNICAFESLDYTLVQDQATLIFGNNMDSDSQNSNGSGKSAMIEAIALGLTGEPLRKVNMDEIINDRFDIATVRIVLWNEMENVQMTVARKLSRKQPQEILIQRQTGPYDTDVEEVKLSSVADYNKYVLDQIGLSKDDLFSNFILTTRKYKSFLSSSDKEKKELINRFSNGILVDESIDALLNDMEPVKQECIEADKKVAECQGSIAALEIEIEKAVNDSEKRKASRLERIEEWKSSIVAKRAEIRTINQEIAANDDRLATLDELDVQLQDLEKSAIVTHAVWKIILDRFKEYNIDTAFTDYNIEIQEIQNNQRRDVNSYESLTELCEKLKSTIVPLRSSFATLKANHTQSLAQMDVEGEEISEQIARLLEQTKALRATEQKLEEKRKKLARRIASVNNQLAGVIECPKCHHEFLLSVDTNVADLKKDLQELTKKSDDLQLEIDKNASSYADTVEQGQAARQQETDLAERKRKSSASYQEAEDKLAEAERHLAQVEDKIETLDKSISLATESLKNLRKRMFDEVFSNLDSEVNRIETSIKTAETKIAVLNGSIKTYEESIEEAEKAIDDDIISSLKDSLKKNQEALNTAILNKEEVNARLNEFKVQEATFTEFKTHLANSKIDAINQITNEFLEAIGSDIRVALSGYTILKSGKVRDKISVSLLRDGIDCGSFDKFSRGEQTRVELASILAIHHLINTNCEEGKGLNLLIIDELLDATDESGLTNVFRALNDTQTTSLVVSHGNIAENYPNRLIINKQNGVSFI